MAQSPTPKRKIEVVETLPPTVDFLKAVGLLLEWKCMSRLSWKDKNVFIFISRDDGLIKIHRSDDKITDVVLHKHDLESDDWVVTNEDEEQD